MVKKIWEKTLNIICNIFTAIKPALRELWRFFFMLVEKAFAPVLIGGFAIIVAALVDTKVGAFLLAIIASWIAINIFGVTFETVKDLLTDGPSGWFKLLEPLFN